MYYLNVEQFEWVDFFLPDEQLFQLKKLNNKKSKFVVLIKWFYPFYTCLENLKKPDDCVLIGIFAEPLRNKLFDGYEKHFDFIIWFHANIDCSKISNAYSDFESIEVPVIGEIVGQIIDVVPANKIRLLDGEEMLINEVCKIRDKYSILDPRKSDLDVLRNKALLKQACKSRGIPTARFMIVDFQKYEPTDELIKKLEEEIGSYPMFKKPVKGFESNGCGTIKDSNKLRQWIDGMRGKSDVYLVEECIQKREFWAMVILLSDGSWRPLLNLHCGSLTVRQALDSSTFIPFIARKFEDCIDEFPGLTEFVNDVIQKLKPPAPHVFCVQGFQLEPKTSKYLFTECGYRLNGERGCRLTYKNTGINQETAFLSVYMDQNYEPKSDPTSITYSIWYFWTPGTLRSHNELPENAPVKSKVKFEWLVPVGTNFSSKGSTFNEFVLNVEMTHDDEKIVNKDLKYFMGVYRPDIV